MPYGGWYVWSIAVVCSPIAAFVGFYVVGLLAQDWTVAAVSGLAGLIVGLVVGFVDAAFMDADERRSVQAERLPYATPFQRPGDAQEDSHHEEEDEWDWEDEWDPEIDALFEEARREGRDLTRAEEREVDRLVSLQNKALDAERGREWPAPTAVAYFLGIFFGGPIAALAATLVVGWFLGG